MHWFTIYVSIGWLIRAAMVPVILRRQMAPGASVAWLGIIFLHPYIGVALYTIIGETRLGPHRVERHRELIARYRQPLQVRASGVPELTPGSTQAGRRTAGLNLPSAYEPMVLQAEKISGMPVLGNNSVEFLCSSELMVDRLVADIQTAQSHVNLLYYMFAPDSTGERVVQALIAAAGRGITCRVLADAVAARVFFKGEGLARRLESAGIKVSRALPVAPIQRRLPRMDLRNHRKLALIDDRVAFTGSHNLVDPDYGGRRGAPWVDVTARLTGPVVTELAAVFAEDWGFETSELLDVPIGDVNLAQRLDEGTPMQVVPTGPSAPGETFRRVFLAAIQSARQRVTITTPYFVPDETTLVTLMMAADRGVEVKLLLPLVPDHLFTAAAGRAHFSRLLEAGVEIYLYKKGLLHVKSTTVDDAFSVFGSANLDVRSFNLNFELTVLLYGREVTEKLRQIQAGYLADCVPVDAHAWAARSALKRYADSAIALLSPLL